MFISSESARTEHTTECSTLAEQTPIVPDTHPASQHRVAFWHRAAEQSRITKKHEVRSTTTPALALLRHPCTTALTARRHLLSRTCSSIATSAIQCNSPNSLDRSYILHLLSLSKEVMLSRIYRASAVARPAIRPPHARRSASPRFRQLAYSVSTTSASSSQKPSAISQRLPDPNNANSGRRLREFEV